VVDNNIRFDYKISKQEADKLIEEFSAFCYKFTICGSVRRQKSTNGDIDVVAVISDKRGFNKKAKELGNIIVLPTMAIGRTKVGIKFTIYFAEKKNYGSMVWYFTGSNESNDRIRNKSASAGMIINQFGLWKDGKCIASKNEEDIFNRLGIDWIDPVNRI
jgi:DNA polymerase (family 10)